MFFADRLLPSPCSHRDRGKAFRGSAQCQAKSPTSAGAAGPGADIDSLVVGTWIDYFMTLSEKGAKRSRSLTLFLLGGHDLLACACGFSN